MLLISSFSSLWWKPRPKQVRSPQSAAPSSAEEIALRRAARSHRKVLLSLHGSHFEAGIDNLGGGLVFYRLTDPRFRKGDGKGHEDMVTTELEDYRPLRVSIEGVALPPDIVWEVREATEKAIALRWDGDGVEVYRRFEVGRGPYQLWQTIVVRNKDTKTRTLRVQVHAFHYVKRSLEDPGFLGLGQRPIYVAQGLCRHGGEVTRKARNDLYRPHGYGGGIDFVGIENQYFVQALAPSGVEAERCGLFAEDRYQIGAKEADGTLFEGRLRFPVVRLEPGQETLVRVLAYIGPKDWQALERAGHHLPEVVNLGAFAVIAKQFARLLSAINSKVGNLGLAIILLTVLVRIALFPIVDRQFRAMAPLRKLKPELDEINARFANDIERRQAAIMDLYRKHGINPVSPMLGCLPVFLQMPIFFALYTALSTHIDLYHEPFIGWWRDLSAPDPYFTLPIALTVLMHVQQRLAPSQLDPVQERMLLWFMPAMMGVFMLFLPSGLGLYMLTNSVLSLAQQRYNEWRWRRIEAQEQANLQMNEKGLTSQKAPSSTARGSVTSRRRSSG
ncbi:MAG: membrane protein insertase YidC [Sandaracinaceae bacterium]|nr:membrane protein insertase YidC [Sandaracinaceae bacterium]